MKKGSSNIGWYLSVIGVILIGGALVYKIVTKKKKESEGYNDSSTEPKPITGIENFELLKKNIGSNFKLNDKKDIVIVNFDNGNKTAQFYQNDRVFIYGKDKNKITDGNYYDGGKEIVLTRGTRAKSNSVWENLIKVTQN